MFCFLWFLWMNLCSCVPAAQSCLYLLDGEIPTFSLSCSHHPPWWADNVKEVGSWKCFYLVFSTRSYNVLSDSKNMQHWCLTICQPTASICCIILNKQLDALLNSVNYDKLLTNIAKVGLNGCDFICLRVTHRYDSSWVWRPKWVCRHAKTLFLEPFKE